MIKSRALGLFSLRLFLPELCSFTPWDSPQLSQLVDLGFEVLLEPSI